MIKQQIENSIGNMVHSLDPNYVLDEEAVNLILGVTDSFLEKVVDRSYQLAAFRNTSSTTGINKRKNIDGDNENVSISDLQNTLIRDWGINIPLPQNVIHNTADTVFKRSDSLVPPKIFYDGGSMFVNYALPADGGGGGSNGSKTLSFSTSAEAKEEVKKKGPVRTAREGVTSTSTGLTKRVLKEQTAPTPEKETKKEPVKKSAKKSKKQKAAEA